MNPPKLKTVGVDLLAFGAAIAYIRQCRKPAWLPGRFVVAGMNWSHSGLTAWGLSHLSIAPDATVLDVGCGGGRTVETLADAGYVGVEVSVDAGKGWICAVGHKRDGA